MPATKEQIRQIIADNNLNSVADVYTLLRDSFKDILQELMEAEMDASLGYEKNQKGDVTTSNKRNGHAAPVEPCGWNGWHVQGDGIKDKPEKELLPFPAE